MGDLMKHTVTLKKPVYFSGLNIAGNVWDNERTQLNKLYKTDQVVFKHFNAEIFHIWR